MNIDAICLCYNALPFFKSGFWSGKFARAVLLFYWKGLSTKEEFFSKGYKPEAIFKQLDAFPKPCCQIPLLKEQTLPLTLPSSHPGWHLQQTLFCLLKLKLVSQELYNQAVESIIKQGKELAWWEVGKKGQQRLKTSDIPLTDNGAWNQNCSTFSLTGCHSLHFHATTSSPNPAPRHHALPSQLPAIAQPVLGTSLQLVFRFFFYPPSVTLLMVLALPQASSTSCPGKLLKLLSTQWSIWNEELREPTRSLK